MMPQQETDLRRAQAASKALQARIKKENAEHDAQQARLREQERKQEQNKDTPCD